MKNSSLNVLGELPKTEENTLLPPLTLEELRVRRKLNFFPEKPDFEHPYIKEGVFLKGFDVNKRHIFEYVERSVATMLKLVHSVEDDHIKALTLLSAGFVRSIEFSIKKISNSQNLAERACSQDQGSLLLEINIFFRFTTDSCPSAVQMLRDAKAKVSDNFLADYNLSNLQLNVDCIHGGSNWSVEDVHDERQRLILQYIDEAPEEELQLSVAS